MPVIVQIKFEDLFNSIRIARDGRKGRDERKSNGGSGVNSSRIFYFILFFLLNVSGVKETTTEFEIGVNLKGRNI